jgi:hypothetical protein
MQIPVDDVFRSICDEIRRTDWSEADWAEHEADDWFQRPPYTGGFCATEMAFCFGSIVDGSEVWFQLSLADVHEVLAGRQLYLQVRPAEL